jgi:hypothetical protein
VGTEGRPAAGGTRLGVVENAVVVGVAAGEERGAARAADRRSEDEVRKLCPVGEKRLGPGHGTLDVALAGVVEEHDYDVRRPRPLPTYSRQGRQTERADQDQQRACRPPRSGTS